MEADTSRKFSPSKLDTYKDCPKRYQYRYVDKIKRDVQSVEAFLGQCVHAAFETLYEGILHGKTLTLDEALGVFEEAWRSGWSSSIQIRDAKYSPEDWRNLGRECVKLYYDKNKPFDAEKTVAVEKRIGFPIEAAGQEYQIEGFIDRLALGADGAFEIHDYKTSKTLPTQEDADSDWQLAIYDLAVRHAWPDTRKVRLLWHYVRHGKTLVSERAADQLEKLKGEIAALIETIKRDHDFAPRKSALCDWCEYRDLCPLWSHAERVSRLPAEQMSRDEGVRLVDELAAVESKKRDLKDKLKGLEREANVLEGDILRFADAQGLLAVTGRQGEVTIAEKDEYRFPTKTHAPEALEALERELKESPLWKDVSHLDSHRLIEGYKRKEWPERLWQLAESVIGRYAKHAREKVLRFHRRKESPEE